MSCLPGMPCFGNHPNNPSPITCGVDPCFIYKTTTDLAHYVGPNLPCIEVNTCETLTVVIQKIDNALCGENLTQTFIDTLLTNETLFELFCTQVIQNCINCSYIEECITCDYVNGCIPEPTTTSTSTTAIPCFCYEITVASGSSFDLYWVDCVDGYTGRLVTNETFSFCAQKNTVAAYRVSGTGNFTMNGGIVPCSSSLDC